MASNTNIVVYIPVDAPVDAPSKLSIWPAVITAPFNLVFGRKTSETKPQNRRLFNILQAMLGQDMTTGASSKQHEERATKPRDESMDKGMLNGNGDNIGTPVSKQRCATLASSSTRNLSDVVPHASAIAIPKRNASDKVNDASGGWNAFPLNDRLLKFLGDVPGWGSDRAAPLSAGSYEHTADGHSNEADDDLQFPMDDLFDFDKYCCQR